MKSYFHQPGTFPYVYETIPERVKKLADESPDKVAMVVYHSKEERHQITRKEVYERSLKFARALLKLGIKKGDRVAYCVSNCINWLAYDVGILIAGGVVVHLLLGPANIKDSLSGCSLIILDNKQHWDDLLTVAKIHPGGRITSEECPSLKLAIAVSPEGRPVNTLLASELMADCDTQDTRSFADFPVVDPDDVALINQTSGTTGVPKKIKHTHFNVVNTTLAHDKGANCTDKDVWFNSRPMVYIGGYPFAYVGSGTKIVNGDPLFLNDPQNFDTVVDIWRNEGCTIVGVAPFNMKNLRDFGFRMRVIASGGDLLTKEMIEKSFVFGDNMLLVYASTEAIMISLRLFTKENIDEHQQGMLGRPVEGVEVKIVNNKDEIVDLGQLGILCVRSPWMMKGYDGQNSPLKNGWFHTTDVCVMLPGGDLIMKGRTSDFIIKSTVNLPIQLIESYVSSHPDVQKVVVVGIPDADCGEDVCACVEITHGRKFDSDALKKFCELKMKSKSSFDSVTMVPSHFLQFDHFPETMSGKLDKMKIKELAIERIKKGQ